VVEIVKGNGCFVEQREGWKMAFVEPSKGRAKITDLGDTLRIEIPTHPGGFVEWVCLFLLTGCLIGWAVVGGLFALRASFSVEWLIVWTVGGILAGCLWLLVLLMLVGREVIMVSPMSLDIVIRPIGYVRRYRLTEISNLRVEEERREFTEGVSSKVGVIVFDYGVSTVRFGLWLEPAEARQIVALLKERFGQYMADGEAGGMKDDVFVEPYKPRARIAETGNAIQIEIPFRPKSFMARLVWLLFTSFLLGSWYAVFILSIKAPTQDKPLSLFTAIFAVVTVVWLFFNLVFSGVWWQMTFGREIVTVTPQELILWWRPFGRRRRFRLAEVKNLRVLEDTFSVFWPYARGYPPFVVTFDYGAGTVRFGANLDPAEARQIVALLKERFGQYMADGKAGGMEDGVR
jgi:hypothetical protein